MKGKRLLLVALVAIAVTIGVYFAVGHLRINRDTEYDPLYLENGFGIAQASVEFVNVYPGWVGSAPLTVINGNDKDRVLWVNCQPPNPEKLKKGYEAFPEEYYSWITITGWDGTKNTTEPEVVLAAGENHELTIVLAMPEDADYANKRAEVRIRVAEKNPIGLVTIAIESKWYIITAEEQ